MKISPTVQRAPRQARHNLRRSLAWCVLGSALIGLTIGCGSSSGGNTGSDAATVDGQTTGSGSTNTAGMDGGMDAAAMDDAPIVSIEAAAPDGGGGPATCSQYMGHCGAYGGQCCSGLGCVNDTFCCVNPAGVVNGSCDHDYECCSGVCQDGGIVGICCSGPGQACSTVAACCTGLQCGSNGQCG